MPLVALGWKLKLLWGKGARIFRRLRSSRRHQFNNFDHFFRKVIFFYWYHSNGGKVSFVFLFKGDMSFWCYTLKQLQCDWHFVNEMKETTPMNELTSKWKHQAKQHDIWGAHVIIWEVPSFVINLEQAFHVAVHA